MLDGISVGEMDFEKLGDNNDADREENTPSGEGANDPALDGVAGDDTNKELFKLPN